MEFKPTNPRPREAGFTLVELLIGTTLGSLLLVGVASLYLFSTKSFVSMTNYADLNRRSREASDLLSRDIRSASAVSSATSTATNSQLVLHFPTANVTYTFDVASGALSRLQLARTTVVLEGITSLRFSLYQRPASGAGYETFPTATAATAKLVGFDWSCSRKVYGTMNDTEDAKTELVELRNQ